MTEHNIDEQILHLCTGENSIEEGFNLLMKTYGKRLYWHIRRLIVSEQDAEDVLQETFINIFRFIRNFRGHSKLYTWLYTIATRECTRYYRQKKLTVEWPDEGGAWLAGNLYAENSLKAETILYKFHEAILKLPEKQRLVFNMRYFDGLSYEEISTITESSVASLKTNYHYAFEKIKTILSNGI